MLGENFRTFLEQCKKIWTLRKVRIVAIFSVAAVIVISLWTQYLGSTNPIATPRPILTGSKDVSERLVETIELLSSYLVDYTLDDSKFGEMGRRVEILGDWLKKAEDAHLTPSQRNRISTQTQNLASSLFGFLPPNPSIIFGGPQGFEADSRGIVIPVGKKNFRYACHLVVCLREVLHSNLPIQIAYAGDNDLPPHYRERILSLTDRIEGLDILQFLEDTNLAFSENGWAVKPFSILASKFQHTILLDADAVFLQPPERLFDTHGYRETGTFLFHDRLLWKGNFQERHQWWREQMKHRSPSATLLKSLVWTEDYAEEGDSGVVAVDKGRIPVMMGLLHICWQNTKSVREKYTYKITFGDKESWWFGFELSNVPYAMEAHYASIVGSTIRKKEDADELCAFTIAHVDEQGNLLWYNGSLMKNKAVNLKEFELPTHWMIDGIWWKGGNRAEMSCMSGAPLRTLTEEENRILSESVMLAENVDKEISDFL